MPIVNPTEPAAVFLNHLYDAAVELPFCKVSLGEHPHPSTKYQLSIEYKNPSEHYLVDGTLVFVWVCTAHLTIRRYGSSEPDTISLADPDCIKKAINSVREKIKEQREWPN